MRGHVQKRGKTWSFVIYLGREADGKKKYKWVGGHATKHEAEDALVEALERLRTGMWTDPGRTTVGEFPEQWLQAIQPTVRENTLRSYREMFEYWVIPRIGSLKLAHLNAAHLRSLQSELLASGRVDGKGGLSAQSVLKCHRTLKHAFKDAVRWGLVPRNPVDLIDPPRVAQAETTAWTADEARRFLDGIASDRLFAMWVLFVTSGMRRGEMAGLKWTDLDSERGVLVVQRAVISAGKGTEVRVPPTSTSTPPTSTSATPPPRSSRWPLLWPRASPPPVTARSALPLAQTSRTSTCTAFGTLMSRGTFFSRTWGCRGRVLNDERGCGDRSSRYGCC